MIEILLLIVGVYLLIILIGILPTLLMYLLIGAGVIAISPIYGFWKFIQYLSPKLADDLKKSTERLLDQKLG